MAYQAILRAYMGFSGGGWPWASRAVRVADMGGSDNPPPRSPYKPSQVPHSAQGRLKSQKAAFPLGEEVRISRLGLKPAPRSEKADIGSTEKLTDIRRITSSQLRPGACSPPAYAISAEKTAPLAHSPMRLLHVEQLVPNKKRPRRYFRGSGLRNRTARPQIDGGGRWEVFSSTSQRNTVL